MAVAPADFALDAALPTSRSRLAPATMTMRSSASALREFSRIFATASGNDFSRRLKSSKTLASLRSPKSGLMSSRSLRESSPTFGMTMATIGSSGSMLSVARFSGAKAVAHIGHRGQAHVGLVDAVLADGVVVGHAREWSLQIDADGLERGGEESFDDGEDAFRGAGRSSPSRSA